MVLGERPACLRNFGHEILFVSVLSCAQLLTQAALGNVLVPLHIIGPAIGISDNARLPWTLAAYSLTVGIFIMITGRLGDIYGHKLLTIIGYVIFSIFSILVGITAYVGSDIYFDIMRAFQGIGPATLLPNVVALLARAYDQNERRKSFVFSMFGATAPSGFIIGALFGSIFAQLVWWPWAQYVLAIFCALLAVLAWFVVPDELSPAVTPDGKVDILGAIIGTAGLTLFIYSWNEAPVSGWDKPYVFVLLIVSVLVIVVFVIVELKVDEPIMPPSLWTYAGFPGVLACIALGWSSFGVFIFYIIQFIQVINGASPLLTTAMMSPIILSGLAATILVSILFGRVPTHYLLTAAMCCFCAGNILVATVTPNQIYWGEIFFATLITPFGMDISYPAASLIVSNAVPADRQGVAASMVNTVVNWSISLGLGIAGTVESQMLKNGKTTLEGFNSASYVGIGLSGLGILVSLIFCRVPKKNNQNEHGTSPNGAAPSATVSKIVVDSTKVDDDEAEGSYPMTSRF